MALAPVAVDLSTHLPANLPTHVGAFDILPVDPPLDALFPYGGPLRGSVVAVEGSASLMLAVAAAASTQGWWGAAVGFPALGLAAAAEVGVDLARFVVVPTPGEQWASAAAVLLDGLGFVAVQPPRGARATEARRLAARTRERRAVLLVTGAWPESVDLRMRLKASEWTGIGGGYGRLTDRRITVTVSGRGAASRERQVTTWLPRAH